MRTSSKFMLASAAILLAGSAVLAASLPRTHQLVLQLPGGGTETISYAGDVAPQIRIAPAMATAFTPADPAFPMPDLGARMAVAMRNWQATMQSRMFAASANGGTDFIVSNPGGDFCMREIVITSTGNGRPHMVSHSAGNCGAASGDDARFQPAPADNAPLIKAGARLPVYTVAGQHI